MTYPIGALVDSDGSFVRYVISRNVERDRVHAAGALGQLDRLVAVGARRGRRNRHQQGAVLTSRRLSARVVVFGVFRHFADWARETLRGPARSIGDTVLLLTERINRDMPVGLRNHLLIVVAVAFALDASRTPESWIFQIANSRVIDEKPVSEDEFTMINTEVRGEPTLLCLGSGVPHVPESRRRELLTIIQNKPRRPSDYLGLLAAEIRSVAAADSTVSAWSQGCYMPASGFGPFQFEVFREPGDVEADPARMTPFLHLGVDVSALVYGILPAMADRDRGMIDDAQLLQQVIGIGHSAISPRD